MASAQSDLAPLDSRTLEKARRALVRSDPRLAGVIRRAGPCRIAPGGDAYDGLVRAVVHQQLAGAAAAAIEGRVRALGRGRFPRPKAMLALSAAALRGAGLSQAKHDALRGIAAAFASRRLSGPALARMNNDDLTAAVTSLRGIGPWSAHMLLIFSLGRSDVLPVGDYGVRKAAMLLYGLDDLPKPPLLEKLAEPWRPWRSVASWYLWRSLDLPKPDSAPGAATA
jgi:DNA-3-methyladenine glycosylase II